LSFILLHYEAEFCHKKLHSEFHSLCQLNEYVLCDYQFNSLFLYTYESRIACLRSLLQSYKFSIHEKTFKFVVSRYVEEGRYTMRFAHLKPKPEDFWKGGKRIVVTMLYSDG